ncbi:MAG: MBL fold metallo-hydrolase [Desulfatiglans sp.]|jgi:7,8-dihydropterin-6-yl-methyl-4-(beta-D-ribofuranosyl)aminobenzene 5'-phosphate synthase|nr:MBL fold metallo-hydrolase [Desulfatiglans sp.]
MKKMKRREFLKTVAIGGASLGLGNAIWNAPLEALAGDKYDIGQCKSVRIKCISELGWYDTKVLIQNMKAGGGPRANQWDIAWDPKNAAGSCTLIDMEALDGRHHKFLLDTGWSTEYMDQCYQREGVDRMLKNGDIDCLVISHEHLDHYWGLESTLKNNPEIKIFIPSTFYSEGTRFLQGAQFAKPNAKNTIAHRGKLVKCQPGHINKLYDGCALVGFDLPIVIRVRGEQSLYFNVKDKGMVCVTGCCHQGILNFSDFAQKKIVDGDKMYGVYGGLHIAPFGPIDPKRAHLITGMAQYNFQKVACNHCTGLKAVEKMIELDYPLVKGSGKFGSVSDLYVGAGDEVFFG